jgi:hypothetical protein
LAGGQGFEPQLMVPEPIVQTSVLDMGLDSSYQCSLQKQNDCHSPMCWDAVHGSGGWRGAGNGGSSPRVWGIRFCRTRGAPSRRFIPTRVGNTASSPALQGAPTGSSPRVWGILPAAFASTRSETVHPHACGEYVVHLEHPCEHGGSSPRVWGIPHGLTPLVLPRRFIPTRVGNTLA